ncbi:MAG: AzlD domain-containing protein [Treponema sp.]|nr:AzlD domain-containing protein [Treponema sp.]
MTGALPLYMVLAANFLSAVIIFMERFFPFALFGRREPPKIITFVERFIPSMVITVLVVYCLKDVAFSQAPFGAPYLIAIAVTVLLQVPLRNSMVSIFSGTIVFMVLSRLM